MVSVEGTLRSWDLKQNERLGLTEDDHDVNVLRLKGKMEVSEAGAEEHGPSRFWRRWKEAGPGSEPGTWRAEAAGRVLRWEGAS